MPAVTWDWPCVRVRCCLVFTELGEVLGMSRAECGVTRHHIELTWNTYSAQTRGASGGGALRGLSLLPASPSWGRATLAPGCSVSPSPPPRVRAAVTLWSLSPSPAARVTRFGRPDWEVLRAKGCLSDNNAETAVPRKPGGVILAVDAAVNIHTHTHAHACASWCSGVSLHCVRDGASRGQRAGRYRFSQTPARLDR